MGVAAVSEAEQMAPPAQPGSPAGEGRGIALETLLDEFVESKQKGDGGNYARQAESVVGAFIEWAEQRDVVTVDDLSPRVMQSYAQRLSRRVASGSIAASTASTYWGVIRAWLEYAVAWNHLDTNPAALARVEAELPEPADSDDENSDTSEQFWSPEERTALCRHVDEQADRALDEDGLDAVAALRDRALVYLLGYSGVRGGEVLRDPNDDRRDGLRWSDVYLDAGYVLVRGKSQEMERASLPEQVRGPLSRWRRLFDPPTDEWPVFPTLHRPTLYAELGDDAFSEPPSKADLLRACADAGAVPPSLTTGGLRSLLQRLTDAAGIEPDGRHDYLTPHGARRGAGEVLYRNVSAEAAQRQLRHADPSTTSEMYSHIEAGEQADVATEAFEESDG
jgi:integrase